MEITKRELFAAMAMQGILCDASRVPSTATTEEVVPQVAIMAVQLADALLTELAKEPTP